MDNRNEFTKLIFNEIKNSRKYQDISDEIIINEINTYLNKNPKLIKKNKFKKSDISKIKSNLHRIYASYQLKNKNKRILLMNKLKKDPDNKNIIIELLKTHLSTRERINHYPSLYKQIFKITNKPYSIIDLGCGLNPISIPYMNIKNLQYNAYDIEKSEINILNEFFKSKNLKGKADILDIKDLNKINNIPDSDIIFLFKLIDLIDTKKKKYSEELIKILLNKSKFIIASFATKTISGKNMNLPRRTRFEFMLKRNNLKYKTITLSNEIFYIIYK